MLIVDDASPDETGEQDKNLGIVEVPFTFHERVAGESKMSLWIAAEGIVRVAQLRLAA